MLHHPSSFHSHHQLYLQYGSLSPPLCYTLNTAPHPHPHTTPSVQLSICTPCYTFSTASSPSLPHATLSVQLAPHLYSMLHPQYSSPFSFPCYTLSRVPHLHPRATHSVPYSYPPRFTLSCSPLGYAFSAALWRWEFCRPWFLLDILSLKRNQHRKGAQKEYDL